MCSCSCSIINSAMERASSLPSLRLPAVKHNDVFKGFARVSGTVFLRSDFSLFILRAGDQQRPILLGNCRWDGEWKRRKMLCFGIGRPALGLHDPHDACPRFQSLIDMF